MDVYKCHRPLRYDSILDLSVLSTIAESSPLLLGGDFNAQHPVCNDLSTYCPHFKDPTYRKSIQVLVITFTNDYLASKATSSLHQHLNNDHSALSITLEMPRMTSPPHLPRWKTRTGSFSKILSKHGAKSYSTEDKNLNQLEADLKGAITEAANSAIPLKTHLQRIHKSLVLR